MAVGISASHVFRASDLRRKVFYGNGLGCLFVLLENGMPGFGWSPAALARLPLALKMFVLYQP